MLSELLFFGRDRGFGVGEGLFRLLFFFSSIPSLLHCIKNNKPVRISSKHTLKRKAHKA